jgi:hypothetical protein
MLMTDPPPNRKDDMSSFTSRLAGAAFGALVVIGAGGAGLAFAQTAEETPSTTAPPAEAPATPAPDTADPDCPEKDGAGARFGRGRGGGGGQAPSQAPSTDSGAATRDDV